jgi:hypothetical protein
MLRRVAVRLCVREQKTTLKYMSKQIAGPGACEIYPEHGAAATDAPIRPLLHKQRIMRRWHTVRWREEEMSAKRSSERRPLRCVYGGFSVLCRVYLQEVNNEVSVSGSTWVPIHAMIPIAFLPRSSIRELMLVLCETDVRILHARTSKRLPPWKH